MQQVEGLSQQRPGFGLGSFHMGYVVNKPELEKVPLQVLRLLPVSIVPLWFSILLYHLGNDE
jgi:hypothetical protein